MVYEAVPPRVATSLYGTLHVDIANRTRHDTIYERRSPMIKALRRKNSTIGNNEEARRSRPDVDWRIPLQIAFAESSIAKGVEDALSGVAIVITLDSFTGIDRDSVRIVLCAA